MKTLEEQCAARKLEREEEKAAARKKKAIINTRACEEVNYRERVIRKAAIMAFKREARWRHIPKPIIQRIVNTIKYDALWNDMTVKISKRDLSHYTGNMLSLIKSAYTERTVIRRRSIMADLQAILRREIWPPHAGDEIWQAVDMVVPYRITGE